jgi:hypothetical protein
MIYLYFVMQQGLPKNTKWLQEKPDEEQNSEGIHECASMFKKEKSHFI